MLIDHRGLHLWCSAPKVHRPGPMALGLDGAGRRNASTNAHAEASGSSRFLGDPGPAT